MRPFSDRAGVACRAASLPLQRVLADFGADHAFGRVPDKLREHYGIDMPASTARRTTERHAQSLFEKERAREVQAGTARGRLFVGEMDGSMVPVAEVAQGPGDKRKGKALVWKEARLCLVHPLGARRRCSAGTSRAGWKKAVGNGSGVR